jgi:hypothetical protein
MEENGRVLVFVDVDRMTNFIVRPFISRHFSTVLCLNYLYTLLGGVREPEAAPVEVEAAGEEEAGEDQHSNRSL